jgi:uncharacterized membrane protein
MNKQQYLGILRQELKNLGPAAVDEIIRDFEEHYANGLVQGKSENEITADLGSPTEIARQYLEGTYEGIPPLEEPRGAGQPIQAAQAGQTAQATQSTQTAQTAHTAQAASAAPKAPTAAPAQAATGTQAAGSAAASTAAPGRKINETALVLVIVLNILFGIPIWISLFTTLFGCWVAAGGIGVAALVLFVLAIVQAGYASLILALFGLSLTALAILVIILMVYLSKWLVIGLVHYVRWNGRLVTRRQAA